MPPNPPAATTLARAVGLVGAVGVVLIGALALLQTPPPGRANRVKATGSHNACALGPEGALGGQFFGAINLTVDWSGNELACDGMEKPDGGGVRLYFAGDRADGGRLALLIGLPGRRDELAGGERPANVTVIDERDGRFFSSAGPGRCWASIQSVTSGAGAGSRIDGLVYCVGALPSVGDRSSLTLSDLKFSGWVATRGD
ncbi:MAG: hypothetical protein ABIX37_05460 [Gammaproteobacteria bacterium]